MIDRSHPDYGKPNEHGDACPDDCDETYCSNCDDKHSIEESCSDNAKRYNAGRTPKGDLDVRVVRSFSDGTGTFETVPMSSLNEHLRSLLLGHKSVTLEKDFNDMHSTHRFQAVPDV